MAHAAETRRNSSTQAIAEISEFMGDRLSTSQAVCDQHGNDVTWHEGEPPDAEYVVAGENQLLGSANPDELERLQELFAAFQRKKDLLHLLERCSRADGVQVFIGEEAGYEVFGDYSVVTAPYSDGVTTLGVLGVIGPTRMAYERVIPIVDVTARMLSSALSN